MTLFGIRSNIAIILVGSLYLIISLHTTVNGMKAYQEFLSEKHSPSRYLLINTETHFFHITSLFLSVFCLLSSISLILGIIEKRCAFLRPWLLFTFILEYIFAKFFFYFIYLSIKAYKDSWLNVCGLLLAVFISFMSLAFHEYISCAINILYKKFKKDSRRLYPVLDNDAN